MFKSTYYYQSSYSNYKVNTTFMTAISVCMLALIPVILATHQSLLSIVLCIFKGTQMMHRTQVLLVLCLDSHNPHQTVITRVCFRNATERLLSSPGIRLSNQHNVTFLQVMSRMKPLVSGIEVWQKLLTPALPELSQKLLHTMPPLFRVVDLFVIECFRGKRSSHFSNKKVIRGYW